MSRTAVIAATALTAAVLGGGGLALAATTGGSDSPRQAAAPVAAPALASAPGTAAGAGAVAVSTPNTPTAPQATSPKPASASSTSTTTTSTTTAPAPATIGAFGISSAGRVATLHVTSTDETARVLVSWGDGTTSTIDPETVLLTPGQHPGDWRTTHTYADAVATYTVTAQLQTAAMPTRTGLVSILPHHVVLPGTVVTQLQVPLQLAPHS